MRAFMFALGLTALALASRAGAQTPDSTYLPPAAPASQASAASLTNPAISVIGWFQGAGGSDGSTQSRPFELREAEVGLQAAVDPFTRADFFLSAGPEGLDVEEGYITWLALPGGGQAKVGKFRADLGKFNRTHTPETPFADRPRAAQAFLGEEGLATMGVSASAILPNPMSWYWDVTANVGSVPDGGQSPVFEPASRSDLLTVGRSSLFVPLRESTDLNLGVSYANGAAVGALLAEGSRAQLGVADATLRWKSPRRSIYRSLLAQIEWIAERGSASGTEGRAGFYAYAIYQVARQWKVGLRLDDTERPSAPGRESGALALAQYQPSEFSTLSVQVRRVRDAGRDRDFDAAFFKWTFSIGPHGAHPY